MRKILSKLTTCVLRLLIRTTDDTGRYYVIIRNLEGTSGDVYINFHGDRLSSCGEQQLSKCENYPEHPFSSQHTVRHQQYVPVLFEALALF